MKRFNPLSCLTALAAIALTAPAFAERYGSETDITIEGRYFLPGTYTTTPLDNGDVLDTAAHETSAISNRTILAAMRTRGLIPNVNSYRLVLVGRAHMADGIALFATHPTNAPVKVPADLLGLVINDGPVNGFMVVDSNAVLKRMKQKTRNLTKLTQGKFNGSGMLTQEWTSKSVQNGDVTEVIELVEASGSVSGVVTSTPDSGVGLLNLTFTGSDVVDLTRYGMATTGTGTMSGGTMALSVSGWLNYNALVDFSSISTLVINHPGTTTIGGGSSFYSDIVVNNGTFVVAAGSTLNFTGTLTINTTTGGWFGELAVTSSGSISKFPTFVGGIQPSMLIIITRSGAHIYTRNTEGMWTPKAP